MKPYKHQELISDTALEKLRELGWVYLAMEERTGKTLTAILTFEKSVTRNALVLTKKKAINGWEETISAYTGTKGSLSLDGHLTFKLPFGKTITVTNYEAIHRRRKTGSGKAIYDLKFTADYYDFIILDESHANLSAYPKTGVIWKSVAKLTVEKPIVYLSATPFAQGYQLLFNQLKLSSWSPWRRFANFYRWHDEYGIPDKIRTPYGIQETYKRCKPQCYDEVKSGFITYTRKELNFEHEPEDVLHWVELSDRTKDIYNYCLKHEVLPIDTAIPLDSPMKLRTTLHMLEGGVAKNEDEYLVLDNTEKIDYIKQQGWDNDKTVIMYNYIAEGKKLNQHFRRAVILQGTSYAEGVDLSEYDNLVIYSQDFSTARHSQRRARQANKKRDRPIRVHFILVKGAVSEQVYQTVSVNKTNFVDKMFERKIL